MVARLTYRSDHFPSAIINHRTQRNTERSFSICHLIFAIGHWFHGTRVEFDDQLNAEDAEVFAEGAEWLLRDMPSLTIGLPPRSAFCYLLSAYCVLPPAFCLLLSAYCLLLTAHCSLLTAYCSLSARTALMLSFRSQHDTVLSLILAARRKVSIHLQWFGGMVEA